MDMNTQADLTLLIQAWKGGDLDSVNRIVEAAYPRLRYLADSFLRHERAAHTLQATALVHELYLVLSRQRKVDMDRSEQFYSFAAYLTRLILRNRARDRRAQKRGSGAVRVPLSEEMSWIDASGEEMLDFNRAMDELAELDSRKVRLMDLTIFLGCSVEEAAGVEGISRATAERDLRFARAWMRERLRPKAAAGVE